MEKAPIKKFAVEARRKLIADVTFRLERYGITEKGIVEPQTSTDKELVFDLGNGNTQIIKGERYVNRYRNLAAYVRGFYVGGNPKQQLEQFIEKIAFTWFNRLIAIRFMEVNRYIPVRVLSSEIEGQKLPDLVASPFSGDLEFTDAEKQEIFDLQDANKEDDLFRFLFFRQCNALSRILPRLFEDLDGSNSFSELLVALSFNDPNGVVYHLVNDVEEPWFDIHATGQVQIMGWMYQYYNTEPKDKVFADLKKNIKISKQNIPAATQLFTPDWIVRYMVENSLGRLWYEGHPGFDKSQWKYYLDEAPQEPQVEQQLQETRTQYAKMEPEQLKVIDPCMGSGHILCYLFDVLMQIYLDNGYSKREAVRSILENNLFGLDIDKRAAQIAYFSVMMKAREYDSGFLNRKNEDGTPNILQPRVYEIQESQPVTGPKKEKEEEAEKKEREEQEKAFRQIFVDGETDHWTMFCYLQNLFADAKEYGSILQPTALDYAGFLTAWKTVIEQKAQEKGLMMWYLAADRFIPAIVELASVLCQKYDAVVTNPPYMGSSGMDANLTNFIKKYYPDSKSDLFAVFIEVCSRMAAEKRYQAMITQHAWMFLSSYEKLREKMMLTETVNMAHLGARAFEEIGGEVVQTTSFVRCRTHIDDYKGTYCRLIEPTTQQGKEDMFLAGENRYFANQDNFAKIPGSPVAYWVSKEIINTFCNEPISGYAVSNGQNITGNNNKYLRLFWEVDKQNIKKDYWAKCARGGGYRKYHGNDDNVILWTQEAREHYKKDSVARIVPENLRFKDGITWSYITSGVPSFRRLWSDELFEKAGTSVFIKDVDKLNPLLGLLNSIVAQKLLGLLNPTINYQVRDIFSVPVAKRIFSDKRIDEIVNQNISIEKEEWDSFETSWDFKKHPLV